MKKAININIHEMRIAKNLTLQELAQKEYLADICKVAILKYYVGQETEPALLYMLKDYLVEMCEKHLVFAFYLEYPREWLREVQLYDKVLVEYRGSMDGKVKFFYRIQREGEPVDDYHSETLLAVYDNVFVKEFVLYEGETLEYYFVEDSKDKQIVSEKARCRKENIIYEDGKYGRLNLISRLSKEKQYESMLHYRKEEQVAEEIFVTY